MISRSSDNTTLANVAFNVAVPQVSMTVSNGQAVSGTLVITLAPRQAPITVDNFLAYVNSGFYTGVVFHRHVPNFVLQGGGYAGPLNSAAGTLPNLKTTAAPIALEAGRGLSNLRLSVAMARTNDLNSATSQFFINTVDNPSLDTAFGGYAVFGSISAGADGVSTMVAAPCSIWPAFFGNNGPDCLPSPNLSIVSAVQTR